MTRRRTVVLVGLAVAVAGAVGTGTAVATGAVGGDDAEPAITGAALQRASAAALAHTGGGVVSDTEVGDEDSYYEVEVTRQDGSQVDVQLTRSFIVVGSAGDVETEEK
jgi:hypothetical protein